MDCVRRVVAFKRKGQRLCDANPRGLSEATYNGSNARAQIGVEVLPLPRPHWGGPSFASVRVPSR